MPHSVILRVSGARACFSRAEFKTERVSYDVITPSAARGIFDSVYWRPGLRWIIDRIYVLNPIRFQSLSRNEIGDRIPVASVRHAMRNGAFQTLPRIAADNRQRRAATILVEVDYLITARLTLTDDAPVGDRLDIPLGIFTRRARRGQCFRFPCLGTREFPADVMLWEGSPPMHQFPGDQRDRDLGLMLLDIDYAKNHASRFFHAVLRDGVIDVPPFVAAAVRP
ncbi:type I-C CRISPR-associated protein Cas5 (plasmid) [Azospirillum baldaniorum]|uniref:pre-crRNA processing endonuclease n=1 Tax=Azospirillum baldaniorum TaxID=1064539 RepID=A0A9P1JWE6_9PROT|nr:type I-C CRISPR-associated protein Cas5c [Azospirillum baldaniorum]AWJ92469.1 type I-C CRISPR-associated protein Cas5 [Azospirillum baldaniorum]TWA75753.1 CRISPR-associated Cas5d family protein [Azospirillum brasilense]CCD01010.1 CRISPR-associated protein, Csd5d family [Azospirillum baldaniorum]